MRTLIVGANGRIGTRAAQLLLERGHTPIAMIRDAAQAAHFDALGIATVVADLEHPVDHAVEHVDAILFTAGSGSKTGKDKTILIDHLGAIRIATTAEFAGVHRFIMISAIHADPHSEHPTIAHYMKAKGRADEFLRERDIDWTIIRPGRLQETPGQGAVTLEPRMEQSGDISLDDVAAVAVEALDKKNTYQKSFDILEGATPIPEAIAGV